MKYEGSPKLREATRKVISTYFKDPMTGKPFIATDGQCDIFDAITDPALQRVQIETPTQYGKSRITAMAINWRRKTYGKKMLVIAPRKEQAQIIMDYTVQHIFDHPVFQEGLLDVEGLARMKTQRSRDRLVWEDNSEIRTLSAGVSRIQSAGKVVMGFGADDIVVDEANLIPNTIYSKIFRMLGGNAFESKITKIGNPWDRGTPDNPHHFFRTHNDPRYALIWINYMQAIKEGRLTDEFIEEARESSREDFLVLYEVKFPKSSTHNAIFNNDMIESNLGSSFEPEEDGYYFAGLDVAGEGNDKTVLTIIKAGYGWFELISQQEIEGDTNAIAEQVDSVLMDHGNIQSLGVDSVGIGKGVADNLFNLATRNYEVDYYIAGSKADELMYYNKKSELLFRLRKMLEDGTAKLPKTIGQLGIDLLGYAKKRMGDRKIKSEDPVDSPDYADSLLAALYVGSEYKPVNIEFF